MATYSCICIPALPTLDRVMTIHLKIRVCGELAMGFDRGCELAA